MFGPDDSALVYLLPQPMARVVDQWRRRYDKQILQVPPHVTVTYPPFVSELEWVQLRRSVMECLSTVQEFDLHLSTTGVFNSPQKVLWLRPDDNGDFVRIHELLAKAFPRYVPASDLAYIPHVTLGFFETLDELSVARAAVDREVQPMQAVVNQLTLMQYSPEGIWAIRDQIALAPR